MPCSGNMIRSEFFNEIASKGAFSRLSTEASAKIRSVNCQIFLLFT